MTPTRDCIECGSTLSADAPAGLCPHCLLKLALEAASVDGGQLKLPDAPSLAGAKVHYFGDYELIEELGRGGMGVVYKARQMSLNRIVAVKMMRPGLLSSEADVQRFHVEAEAAASLQHPNIVAIHEVGEHEGLCYFSMDFVAGQSLAEIARNEPLSAKRAAGYVKTIAEAVHHAHEHGLLHRDLKPANVIIDLTGRPRITDFGLARRIEGDSKLTETGAVLGTPSYMPPEQAAGRQQDLGPTTDVYSLGAILYELLCGRPPFQAESPVDTLLLVLRTEPVAPRLLNPRLPRDLETICLKCLEKDGRRRYASAKDLADDLGRFLANEPIHARRIGTAGRGWRWCRRNPWQAIAAAGLVLFALVATLSAITLRDRLWRSMVEQARSERLVGNRARSLQLLAEAAQMKESDDLQQEAVQAIVTSGLRLRQAIPMQRANRIALSADSKLIAIAGQKSEVHERRTAFGSSSETKTVSTIEVWEVETGRKLSEIEPDKENPFGAEIVFSPTEPILAQTRKRYFGKTSFTPGGGTRTEYEGIKEQAVIFWNPFSGERIGEVECRAETCSDIDGDLIFSPDGRRAVRGGSEFGSWLIDVSGRRSMTADTVGSLLGFSSDDELLLNCGERLRRYNLATDNEVCVSPEGSSIISVTPDSRMALLAKNDSLVVWDIVAQKQTAVLSRTDEDSSFELMSGDGKMVAIVNKSEPHTIRLYDMTAPGMQERTIALGSNIKLNLRADQIAFSPDGSFLAAFGGVAKLGHLWIWDTRTGAQIAMLRANHSPKWSHDGRLLVTRGPRISETEVESSVSHSFDGITADDNSVNVWDVFGAPPVYLLPDGIGSLAFAPDERQLLSNGVTWDVVSTRDRLELRTSAQRLPADSIALTAGDQLWAVHTGDQVRAAQDGKKLPTRLWKLAPDSREVVLEPPDYSGLGIRKSGDLFARPAAFAISPDGKSLIIVSAIWERLEGGGAQGGGDSVLELWDLEKRTRIAILDEENFHGRASVDISPDGRLVATAMSGEGISIRDLFSGKEIRLIDNSGSSPALKFSPDGKLLFSADSWVSEDDEGPIFVYEVARGREVGMFKGHRGGVVSLAISADGTMLASGGNDRLICLWDIPTGRKLAAWEAHQGEVSALAITRDAGTLVSGGTDGALKLWDLSFIRKELSLLGLGW